MDYPPVGGMLALHGQGEDESYLQMAMEYLKKYLDVLAKKTQARVIDRQMKAFRKLRIFTEK